MKTPLILAAFLLFALARPAFTQPPDEAPPAAAEPAASMPVSDAPAAAGESDNMSMQSMAESMKAMADMCREMMQREMAAMPYKIAAYVFFGALLTLVLVLLAILEVQWIAYWRRLLKGQDVGRPA